MERYFAKRVRRESGDPDPLSCAAPNRPITAHELNNRSTTNTLADTNPRPRQVIASAVAACSTNSSEAAAPDNSLSKTCGARGFKREWIDTFPRLIYDDPSSRAFCKMCQQAKERRLLDNVKVVNTAFITDGYNAWKHALERFKGHEQSDCHRSAVMKLCYMASGQNIASGLSQAKSAEMATARSALHRIVTTIMFLGEQGLAIRGKTEDSSNFRKLLSLRASDVDELKAWLARSRYRWISHDVQNEILQLLANDVLRRVLVDVREARYYAVMIDETSDCSRHEQLVLCLRFCDSQLEIHEVFTGFHDLQDQNASTLFAVTQDILTRFNLDIKLRRGQCFDGASNVAGSVNGLQSKIREAEPRALFVHCSSHSINLVVQDAIRSNPAYRDVLAMFGSLITFVRDSPKRLRLFERLQQDDARALRPYCPTRWIMRD